MAIYVTTTKAKSMLKKMQSSELNTWGINKKGEFTHTTSSEQYNKEAWFVPEIIDSGICFRLITHKDYPLSQGIYSVYHGRFIQMLFHNFNEYFDNIEATAKPEPDIDDPVIDD
jgi:hypothetical protein